MAKLTLENGAKPVVRMQVTSPDSGHTMLFALRSDGKVLRRWTGDLATGYSWFTTLKPKEPRDEASLRKLVEHYGYVVTQVMIP